MSVIKGKGAPDKYTKGVLGDTYIDSETGKKYVCNFVIRLSYNPTEYEWRIVEDEENESENFPGVDFQENNSKRGEEIKSVFIQQVPVETDDSPVSSHITTNSDDIVELNAADIDGEPEDLHKPKYNNYSKQYKKNRN